MTSALPDLHSRLAFFLATDALKELQRANRVHASLRQETVAEHSWHATLLAMLFEDAAPDGIDHDHVRDLLTIHDLVEVYAGDTPLWNDDLSGSADERERAGGTRLMAMLPGSVRERFDPLWQEFQDHSTPEAQFARAIDSLHLLIVSWTEGAQGHPERRMTPAWLLERKRPTIERYPLLWSLVQDIFQGAVDRGLLPPDEAIQRREGQDDE